MMLTCPRVLSLAGYRALVRGIAARQESLFDAAQGRDNRLSLGGILAPDQRLS